MNLEFSRGTVKKLKLKNFFIISFFFKRQNQSCFVCECLSDILQAQAHECCFLKLTLAQSKVQDFQSLLTIAQEAAMVRSCTY